MERGPLCRRIESNTREQTVLDRRFFSRATGLDVDQRAWGGSLKQLESGEGFERQRGREGRGGGGDERMGKASSVDSFFRFKISPFLSSCFVLSPPSAVQRHQEAQPRIKISSREDELAVGERKREEEKIARPAFCLLAQRNRGALPDV